MNYDIFLDQILDGYSASYDIERIEDSTEGLVAKLHMHIEEGQHLILKEIKMWSADADEYVYIFRVPHLTDEVCEKLIQEAYDMGMPLIDLDHISFNNQHMCTHLVALFIVDEADAAAVERVKKCKIYKNFLFSIKGWMEMHTAMVNLTDGSVAANRYGKSTGDYLKMHIDHYRSNVNK